MASISLQFTADWPTSDSACIAPDRDQEQSALMNEDTKIEEGEARTRLEEKEIAMKESKSMQVKMRVKVYGVASVMLFCLALTATPTHAQTRDYAPSRMRLDVPFAFTVGNRTLPAGNYTFERLLNDAQGIDILVVRCNDRWVYHSVATRTVQASDPQQRSKVVFNRYGNRYFLAQIWAGGKLTGLQLHPSMQEIDLRMDQVADEIVLSVPEQATVASTAAPRE
jgi:hypothetical protein